MSIYHIKTFDRKAAELEVSDTNLVCVCAGATRFEINISDIRWVEQTSHDMIRINFLDERGFMAQAAIHSVYCMNIIDDIIDSKRKRSPKSSENNLEKESDSDDNYDDDNGEDESNNENNNNNNNRAPDLASNITPSNTVNSKSTTCVKNQKRQQNRHLQPKHHDNH